MLLQKFYRGLMILVAGHHKQRNPGFRLFHDLHQIVDQTLKNIKLPGNTDIVYTLGIIRPQTGSHASGQKNRPYLTGPYGVRSRPGKGFTICLDLRKLHGGQGRDHSSLRQLFLMSAGFQNLHVGYFDLVKQRRSLLLCQLLIILQDMFLAVLLKLLLRLCQCDTHAFTLPFLHIFHAHCKIL